MAIESYLRRYMVDPEVSVDVLAYNSKVYYVIVDGGGFGESVIRMPITGNETVLDALANIDGLPEVSSKKMWIARPAPGGFGEAQILDVHWRAIAAEGITTTNYQLLPGDRLYVKADHLIATDNFISKLIAPVERAFGTPGLGDAMFQAVKERDIFVMQNLVFLYACLFVVLNMAVDIIIAWLDPRIRYQ